MHSLQNLASVKDWTTQERRKDTPIFLEYEYHEKLIDTWKDNEYTWACIPVLF